MKSFKFKIFISMVLISSGLFGQTQEVNFSAIEGSAFTDYAYEVLKEAYSRIDIELKISALPAKRSLINANSGDGYDGELFRISGVEKKYTNLIPIEVPLILSEWQVYSIEHDFEVNDWESLTPYKIGVRLGIATTDKGTQGMNTEEVRTNEQLFVMLEHGRVDVIVLSKINATKILRRIPATKIKLLSPPVQVIPVYHFIHKKNKDIIPKLTKALSEMQTEGLIDEILKSHWLLLTK